MDPTTTPDVDAAMLRALDLATRGPAHGPSPRVGCVLLGPGSPATIIGEGWHRGAGTPHAEVATLTDARNRGHDTRGATAVVTLEPCNHTGRTGPCTRALRDAGITNVVYALPDPGPTSGGGAVTLHTHGIPTRLDTTHSAAALHLVRHWHHALTHQRPYVTLKTATTLDGRIAAPDGTSQWITGPDARTHAHTVRAQVDAIAVTTGTALADDPALTARTRGGDLATHQPLRVVVGHRDLPAAGRLHGPGGGLLHLRTHDVHEVLRVLHEREVRYLLVEGGPALIAAFLAADAADEIHAYVAPVLLGAGRPAVAPFGVTTLADAPRWHTTAVERLGQDVLVVAQRNPTQRNPTQRTPSEPARRTITPEA
jgi:diaminohydroxyphosphoribosylaminopyrimidine deaminase/5-amino-6-(5-phosphoribosylamino)uracil reductase